MRSLGHSFALSAAMLCIASPIVAEAQEPSRCPDPSERLAEVDRSLERLDR